MNNQPTVTIGSLVRNRAWILPDFLKHIEDIDYPKNLIDILFIVNDSTDDSLQILNNFKNKNKNMYNKITIEIYNKNAPEDKREHKLRSTFIYSHLANLRNYLLSKCKTEKLLSVDSDILVQSNILNKLLESNKEVVSSLIYNGYELASENPWVYPNIMSTNMQIGEKKSYKHINNYYVKNSNELKTSKIIEVDLTGAVILIDKKIYKKAKYGNHIYGEDAIFCENAKKLGYKVYCDLSVFSQHIMSEQQLKSYKMGVKND